MEAGLRKEGELNPTRLEFFFDAQMRAMYDGRWQPDWVDVDESAEEMTA